MALSSLRVRALGTVERLLRRWLGYVEDQLETADQPQVPSDRQPFVSRQPAPPDHWVDLVRESAPQLLNPDAPSDEMPNTDGTVIDYRAPVAPPSFPSLLPPARPFSLSPARPLHPPVNPTRSVTPSSRHPLRLEPMRTQIKAAETLADHPAEVAGEAVEPPTVNTAAGVSESVRSVSTSVPPIVESRGSLTQADAVPVFPPSHRTDSAANPPNMPVRTRYREIEANPVREVSASPGESEQIAAHFADLPADPTIRAASTPVPKRAEIPIVRTREGERARLIQQRTSVPPVPSQVTVQPTTIPPFLNVENVQPERWPSLPESPADEMPDNRSEDQRRERLLREQEGRAWSG